MTRPVVTQGDIGHDLTTINLLLSKHKALEQEILAHEKTLQESMSPGRELIEQGIWGAEKIQQRLDEVSSNWTKLIEMMNQRKTRLTEAVDFHQVRHQTNYPNILGDLGQDYEAPGKDGSSKSSSSVYFEV